MVGGMKVDGSDSTNALVTLRCGHGPQPPAGPNLSVRYWAGTPRPLENRKTDP
jgi:hypothetical protein